MIEVVVLSILGLALCASNLGLGVWVTLLAGFLQDPVRKLWPGQPVYLVGACLVFFAATVVGTRLRGGLRIDGFLRAFAKRLRVPLSLLMLLVVAGTVVTLVRTGNVVMAFIGVISYLTPIPAILVGYHFARNGGRLDRFLLIYIVAVCAMLSGVYLYMLGLEWKVLVPVSEWLDAFGRGGTARLLPGFFRVAENAAWHGSTAICLLIIRQTTRRGRGKIRWHAVILPAFLLGAILLTGRRKALVEVAVFFVLYGFFTFSGRRGRRVLKVGGAAALGTLLLVRLGAFQALTASRGEVYVERGSSAFGDIADRFKVTLSSFKHILYTNGLLGSGVGTGSQGAQYYGGGMAIVGGSAESGPGKVMAELGVPGLVLLGWLAVKVGLEMRRRLRSLARSHPENLVGAYGYISLLIANVAVFVVAHQVFGDPFVLLMLGWIIGFLLALIRVSEVGAAPGPVAAPASLAGEPIPAMRVARVAGEGFR